jgi:hypothetical protein
LPIVLVQFVEQFSTARIGQRFEHFIHDAFTICNYMVLGEFLAESGVGAKKENGSTDRRVGVRPIRFPKGDFTRPIPEDRQTDRQEA